MDQTLPTVTTHVLQSMPPELADVEISYEDFKQFREMWSQLRLLTGRLGLGWAALGWAGLGVCSQGLGARH